MTLGSGAAEVSEFLASVYRRGIQPSFLSVEYTGSGDPLADMTKSFDGYDRAVRQLLPIAWIAFPRRRRFEVSRAWRKTIGWVSRWRFPLRRRRSPRSAEASGDRL